MTEGSGGRRRRRAPPPAPPRRPAPPSLALAVRARPLPLAEARFRNQVRRALGLAGWEGALSVAVVDDREMRTVNRTFHGVDEPTDVLAFPLDRGGPRPARGRGFAGEVVVSLDTARREAAWRGVAPSAELLLYVVHGVLHLLGEDDHAPAAARRMHLRTLAILSALGEANTIEIPRARRGLRTPL